MNRSTRTHKILLVVALIACAIVVVAEFHRHADHADGQCWLCISSFAGTAIPALTSLTLVSWISLGLVFTSPAYSNPQAVSSAPSARAPPARLHILSL
jgi:hypothetical protein